MGERLEITYSYRFENKQQITFPVHLHKDTLSLVQQSVHTPPFWAELEFSRCTVCSLDKDTASHCPVAVNLAPVVEAFRDFWSYETVEVTATTPDRTYSKTVTIQEGLSALLGIFMVTSGCPVMERLKPMVRFHLPFASLEETTYRMLSMYLIAQLYHHRKGDHADWDLSGLETLYNGVGAVNASFAKRLRAAASKDANINAMVNLDCLAKMVPYTVQDILEEMESCFSGLLAL
ncbi:MAG: hypothetical protein HXX17_13495 [Geobacteraceae bacterium]|nr:hypothetical protein [Geobacteraceae bacterium]